MTSALSLSSQAGPGTAHRGVMGVRGDLTAVLSQHAADRLEPKAFHGLADEPCDQRCRRSRSAATKADAASRISLARLGSHTSARRADTSRDAPGRVPLLNHLGQSGDWAWTPARRTCKSRNSSLD